MKCKEDAASGVCVCVCACACVSVCLSVCVGGGGHHVAILKDESTKYYLFFLLGQLRRIQFLSGYHHAELPLER
jgi:hypothetical protein